MVIIRLILTILIFIIPILSYLTEGIMSWMGYDGKHCGEIEMANKIVREIIHGETAAETIYREAEQFEGILRLSKKEILTNAGSINDINKDRLHHDIMLYAYCVYV